MNKKLQEAAAIFTELGWENVTAENILTLPIGTAEQQRTACDGLKSGEWGELVKREDSYMHDYHSYVDVDKKKLALFAVRVGVDPRRAASILSRYEKNDMAIKVIADRGKKYASDFISCVYASGIGGIWVEHSATGFGYVAVHLVDQFNLDIPQNIHYMNNWFVFAATAMGLKMRTNLSQWEKIHYIDPPDLDLIERRFVEHIENGVSEKIPAKGSFGAVFHDGVRRGWLPREKAIELAFSALDASIRPGDRRAWLDVLEKLAVSDKELSSRIQLLIPLLATGDSAVVTQLAPPLISIADDSLLTEVILSALSATTKKARKAVLKSVLDRSRPENADELTSWLSILANDKDKSIASFAERLMNQWQINAELLTEDAPEVQGLWQSTPPVWTPPAFEMGEISHEALTELAAKIVNQPLAVHDITGERFLAMMNALAYEDPDATRTSLRGLENIQPNDDPLLQNIVWWVKDEKILYGCDSEVVGISMTWVDYADPLKARDYLVCLQLGKIPCLLSTPSIVDLTITVPDLASRLAIYQEAGVDALDSDLLLALARLDVNTKTSESVKELQNSDVPVVLQSGDKMSNTAGEIILQYLDDPLTETSLVVNEYGRLRMEKIKLPESLHNFPNRFDTYYHREFFSILPLWGDAALVDGVEWRDDVYHEKGLILRQVARRANPLPPGASINMLAAQRSSTHKAQEDSIRAVTEAWERGLLRPGIADVALLDWKTKDPSNLAALATSLDEIAHDGLLSVVWPILDDIISESLKAKRLPSGTAEIAELMEALLPEVQFAVEKGIAEKTTLDLPGIQSLANKSGSSRAVVAARKVTSGLNA